MDDNITCGMFTTFRYFALGMPFSSLSHVSATKCRFISLDKSVSSHLLSSVIYYRLHSSFTHLFYRKKQSTNREMNNSRNISEMVTE